MSFHSLLNSIIDSQSVTKNSLINETGIDRSSFYQILSGKRIPTKDQITSIIRQLDISAADEMALYDAFYLERLGETNYHYLKFTEKCLRVIGSPYIDTNASKTRHLPAHRNYKINYLTIRLIQISHRLPQELYFITPRMRSSVV